MGTGTTQNIKTLLSGNSVTGDVFIYSSYTNALLFNEKLDSNDYSVLMYSIEKAIRKAEKEARKSLFNEIKHLIDKKEINE